MTQTPRSLLLALALASGLSACGSKDQPAEQTAQTASPTGATAPAETTTAPATAPETPPAAATPDATFDLSSVPVTAANLGTFPFLGPLKGYRVKYGSDSVYFEFDRFYFYTGKNLVPVEGKVMHRAFYPAQGQQPASELMIRRNYENLMKGLGAVKMAGDKVPSEAFEKMGQEEYNKHGGNYLSGANRQVDTYVIRQKDKEVWVQLFVVDEWYALDIAEKAAMPQQATMLKADELKKN